MFRCSAHYGDVIDSFACLFWQQTRWWNSDALFIRSHILPFQFCTVCQMEQRTKAIRRHFVRSAVELECDGNTIFMYSIGQATGNENKITKEIFFSKRQNGVWRSIVWRQQSIGQHSPFNFLPNFNFFQHRIDYIVGNFIAHR